MANIIDYKSNTISEIYLKIFLIKNLPLDGVGISTNLDKNSVIIDDIAKLIINIFKKLQYLKAIKFSPSLISYIHYHIHLDGILYENNYYTNFNYVYYYLPDNKTPLGKKLQLNPNEIKLCVEKNIYNSSQSCRNLKFVKYFLSEFENIGLDDTIVTSDVTNCRMIIPGFNKNDPGYITFHEMITILWIDEIHFKFPLTLRDLCNIYLLLKHQRTIHWERIRTKIITDVIEDPVDKDSMTLSIRYEKNGF